MNCCSTCDNNGEEIKARNIEDNGKHIITRYKRKNIYYCEKFGEVHCKKVLCKYLQHMSNAKNALEILQIMKTIDYQIKEL